MQNTTINTNIITQEYRGARGVSPHRPQPNFVKDRKKERKFSKDPLETSGQDRRNADRIEKIFSFFRSCPAPRGILSPCFVAILANLLISRDLHEVRLRPMRASLASVILCARLFSISVLKKMRTLGCTHLNVSTHPTLPVLLMAVAGARRN